MLLIGVGPRLLPARAVPALVAGACVLLACGTPGGGEALRWSAGAVAPGTDETLVASPEAVSQELGCATAKRPLIRVESDELAPAVAAPGGSLTHRFVYAACLRRGAATVAGTYRRRFSRDGRTVHVALDPEFAFKPGRWRVERVIHVPPDTPSGDYVLHVDLEGQGIRYERSLAFSIGASRSSANTPK